MSNQIQIMMTDSVEMSKPRITKDGYLVGEAHVARTGIQMYLAGELGLDGVDPAKVIRVYRPPEEVFSKDSMASYAHRPVTHQHPPEQVTADNWKKYARGSTSEDVMRDGEMVRVPLILMDKDAIDAYQSGDRELSMGYDMMLELTAGVTDSGEEYDAIQRNMRMNHLALVTRARGGSKLRLGDENLEDPHMDTPKLKTVTVDGFTFDTTEAGAQAIAKLEDKLSTATAELEEERTQRAADNSAHDKEMATKDAELDSLKDQVLDEAALDAKVMERSDLLAAAKSVADKDYKGMSADAIRKTAVAAVLGSKVVDGKTNEYIEARFDILVEDAKGDSVRQAVRQTGPVSAGNVVDKAYNGHVDYLENAYKGDKEVH